MAYDQKYYGEQSGSSTFASSPDAPAEESAFYTVDSAMERSQVLATRVQQLADRLVGSVPTPVSSMEGRNTPGAVFPALRAAAHQTHTAVEDAMSALDRIERALP